MTVGEIYSVIWARTRKDQPHRDAMEEMYEDLQKIKEAKA